MIALSALLLLFLQPHLLLFLLLQTLVLLLLLLEDLSLSIGLLLRGALKVLKRVDVVLSNTRRIRLIRVLRQRRPLSEVLELTIIGITLVFTGGAVIRKLLIFRRIQIVKTIRVVRW